MNRCDVCGLPGEPLKGIRATFPGGELQWVEAPSPGVACSPECATFVFVKPRDMTNDEKLLTAWRWRQRRAESRGEPFDEPAPMDEAERAMVIRLRDWRERFGVEWDGEAFVRVAEASMRGAVQREPGE